MARYKKEVVRSDSEQSRSSDVIEQTDSEESQSTLLTSNGLFKPSQSKRLSVKFDKLFANERLEDVLHLLSRNPELRQMAMPKLETWLFDLAGMACQEKMALILKTYPELLCVQGTLKDISGAIFYNVTIFQYALWSGDVRYIANMMLDSLPNNEEGERIRVSLVEQTNRLMTHGISYQRGDETHTETQFSLKALTKALITYYYLHDQWSINRRERFWCINIGKLQAMLPAHIRHHYCDPEESFCNKPDFQKNTLIRSLSLNIIVKETTGNWNDSLTGLGSEFAIQSSPNANKGAETWRIGGDRNRILMDLNALTTLDDTRTKIDLPKLLQRLETPIQAVEEKPGSKCVIF